MFKRQLEAVLGLDFASKQVFRGVYAMDRLPKRQSPGAYVLNFDDHDEPGSHWVAVYDDGCQVEYMDSYGYPPLDQRCVAFLGAKYEYNSVPLQRMFSKACGYYCLYFILHRARGSSAADVIDVLSRTESDAVVKQFVYSRYKPIFN